ncbi:MAG: glycosyltransferase family 2 protein [Acidobacteriota bacterium]
MKTAERTDTAELSADIDVSLVIPMRDEHENVRRVCNEIESLMSTDGRRYEVIVIDDGSTDGTGPEIEKMAEKDPRFVVIEFTRGFGQAAALAAGFRHARGKIIVAMDGDGQNDPRDIPRLIDRLEGPPKCDIVSGWRKNRQDTWLTRRLPSVLANRLIRRLTWCPEIHDFGCSLKAYRRETLEDIRLYGEMHRFLPALCRWRGARLGELVVNHRPRTAGETKYGLKRSIKVLFDLLTVKFLGDYLTKPIYFFGKTALVGVAIAAVCVAFAIVQKLGYLTEHGRAVMLNDSIFVLFAMMVFITSVMLLMIGVVSELLVRIYHESQGQAPYKIRRVIRADEPTSAESVGIRH